MPEREKALARMMSAVKPGGWLIDEEFDISVYPDLAANSDEVLSKTHVAMTRIMEEHGVDRYFGPCHFRLLRRLGLVSVAAEERTFMWPAGSPGSSLMHVNYEQLRSAMTGAGYVTEQEGDQDVARLEDANFLMPSPIYGQRGAVVRSAPHRRNLPQFGN